MSKSRHNKGDRAWIKPKPLPDDDRWSEEALPLLMAEIADAVPETDEPPLCSCGKHYIGAPCHQTTT